MRSSWWSSSARASAGSKDIAARIPGATLVTYPGMGHALPEELWPDIVARVAALAGLT
jgi:pimeloyl-ACP methyl ester carboxylesterase